MYVPGSISLNLIALELSFEATHMPFACDLDSMINVFKMY